MKFDIRVHTPIVSASLITYNHAPYIRACIEGMLEQKTDFPYEICIGEDESTDGTREICIEYAEKYPDRIRLVQRSKLERGRERYKSLGVCNYIESARLCVGKYIALCDGDDFWIDPLKLQKQFDIMEANPSISLVHSDYDMSDEISGRITKKVNQSKPINQVIADDLAIFRRDIILRKYSISPCTAFMRTKDLLDIFDRNSELFQTLPMGDIPTWNELTNYGSFYYIDESMGTYRILPESDSNSRSAEKKYKFVNEASNLGVMVAEKYDIPMGRIRTNKIKHCNRYALLSGNVKEIRNLHAEPSYKFSFIENCLYQINLNRFIRPVAKKVYELKYKLKSRTSNMH
ncbi:MAG: glycosyltransferase [Pontiella sp.]